jgi:hypothetical protein
MEKLKYEKEIVFDEKKKDLVMEAENLAEEMLTSNFAIISACHRDMSKNEIHTETVNLKNDFSDSICNLLIIPIHGHYKYSDGELADEKSMFFSSKKLTKDFVEKEAKKYNQESYIYNMVLYDTKTGEKIMKFNKIIFRDTSFFEGNNEENYSTVDTIKGLSFKFE